MLLTKIHIPQARENVIPRNRLFDKLNKGLNRSLILVSAPAGYGKTTLVCDWVREVKIPTAWYSVDQRDDDPFEFLRLIISSIQTVHKDIGIQSMELLKSQGAVSIDYILELLINDLLEVESDFLLVVDDLHLLSSKDIFGILQVFIEHSPAYFRIAILTRADPTISLSRFRSQNELTEIRSSDLSFTENDISEFFNRKLKLGLNKEDLHIIETKTEGWIAGLQLAALSLKDKDNKSEFIKGIAGSNRFIMDYLMEEVLSLQNNEIKDFLLHTSILDKLSGSLCDAVLERDNSQSILEELEKSNMFIIPLDNDRIWFRYHHLFRDLLQQKLIQANKDQIPVLQNKACNWFEVNKMQQMAVEHALKAGNIQKGFELLEEIIDYLVETSQYALILRYAELFSGEDVTSSIKHDILYAWTLTITGKLTKAEKILAKLENKLNTESLEPGTEGLLGTMYTTYTLLNDFKGDDESAIKYSELALKYTPEDDLVWSSWAYYCKAGPHLLRLELDESIASLSKGLEYATNTENAYLEIVHNKISFLLKLKGQYTEALRYCNKMLKDSLYYYNNEDLKVNLFASVLYSTVGSIFVEQGKTNEGVEMALKGFDLSQKLVSISFRGYSRYLLSEVYFKTGEFEEALNIINDHDVNLESNTGHWLTILSNALKLKILARLGHRDEAELLYEKYIKPSKTHNFESALFQSASAHYLFYCDRYEEAETCLEKLSISLKGKKILEILTEAELLKVKIFSLTGRKNDAIQCVTNLLINTQDEGFIRSYVNEGEIIADLIKDLLRDKMTQTDGALKLISRDYLSKLNTAFEFENRRMDSQEDGDLSKRELEILQQISKGLSNKDICDTLYISLSTVKTHIGNILLKLEAKNRSEAVEKAREKGIIQEI